MTGLRTERLTCPCHDAVLEVDYLIASGCLIPMAALEKVGTMHEYRQKWLPIHWKVADGYYLVLRYAIYALCAKPHLRHLKMMSLGIWQGLRNRLECLAVRVKRNVMPASPRL